MWYPVRCGLSAVVAATVFAVQPVTAFEPSLPASGVSQSAPEFTPSTDLQKGQLFMTSGLVCDRASEVDAVITLARKGEKLNAALDQINAGTKTPRCIVGRTLIAKYVNVAQAFTVADQLFQVHQVQIVGVAVKTPAGVVPMKLDMPMEQYIVSTDNTVPV